MIKFDKLGLCIAIIMGILTNYLVIAAGNDYFGIESGIRVIYNNYKQCQTESKDTTTVCLKLKALRLADRALSINSIPIIGAVSLYNMEETGRSLSDKNNVNVTLLDESNLPSDMNERSKRLDSMLWERADKFLHTRSLQFKVNDLFGTAEANTETNLEDGRRKKDKKGGMYQYMMMIKGGILALAYKALALLAAKALLVSKLALILALIVAAKKLFSSGGHSQKTTYEIVKTPIITHSHQYSPGAGQTGSAPLSHGNYAGAAGDFSSYEGGPYARSFDMTEENSNNNNNRIRLPTKYVTRIIETVEGRSLKDNKNDVGGLQETKISNISDEQLLQKKFSGLPYAHIAAYKDQLKSLTDGKNPIIIHSENIQKSDMEKVPK